MSITNSFVPHELDAMGSYKPLTFFDRTQDNMNALTESDHYAENDKEVLFLIKAPGLNTNDTKVAVQNGHLRVSGYRHEKSEDGTAETQEQFEKTISLDENALDVQHMQAKLFDHILVVGIPKKTATTSSGSEEKET